MGAVFQFIHIVTHFPKGGQLTGHTGVRTGVLLYDTLIQLALETGPGTLQDRNERWAGH